MESHVRQARVLLARFTEGTSREQFADDLLVFFYRLRDGYHIVGSSDPLLRSKSFVFLNDIIGHLESDPDSVMRDDHSLNIVRAVLEGIVKGTIRIERSLR